MAIDDLLLPGSSDSDQDCISDGYEIAYYDGFDAHTSDCLMVFDSDQEGDLGFSEYQRTLPTVANEPF